jgi:hypothetical protein
MKNIITYFIFILFTSELCFAQVPYNVSPTWTSTANNSYSTGCAWADINRDGWMDLVVSNGNDMQRQRVTVYLNNNGTLPLLPSWISGDNDYHGHLSVGDVNGDGWPDVAVSVYLGPSGFSSKGKVKLYTNINGTLSLLPTWTSQDSMYTFSCAFGDADGDGDLDLAVACGEGYNHFADQNRIYYNNNGVLSLLPGWRSSVYGYSMDAGWADFDNDGMLDLVFVNEEGPNRMYRNYGDSIGTIPVWTSIDGSQCTNSLTIGDINNDGYLDLAVSDNNQLCGTGHFKIYKNNNGTLETTPFWSSSAGGAMSGITLADVTNDGYYDLITGGWWLPCRIYLNQTGSFNAVPQWTSSTGSVVEAITFADYNNDGLDTITSTFTSNGVKKLYYLPKHPANKIINIRFNTDTVSISQYCFDLENGWVTFKTVPANGINIIVKFITSHALDFAVSNWDPNIGNYVFNNTNPGGIVLKNSEEPREYYLSQNYPNPFNPETRIKFSIPPSNIETHHLIQMVIYDLLGREVALLVNQYLGPGTYEVDFNTDNIRNSSSLSSGIYFYTLKAGDYSETKKMIFLK